MTNLPVAPSVSDISAKAAEYPFARTVARIALTTVLSVFLSAGVVIGSIWFSVVFVVIWIGKHLAFAKDTFVYGYRVGARVKTTSDK